MFGPPPPPPLQFVTSDGGASWTSSSPFKALKSILIAGVSCVAPGTCEAAGSAVGGPWAARTSDGGSTWSRQSLPVVKYTGQPTSISCATTSFCEIALSEGIYAGTYATRNGGDSWSFHLDHTFGSQPASIDCLATGTCYLGGFWAGSKVTSLGLLEVTNDFGNTWTRMRVPPSTTGVDSVACVSSTSCLLLSTDYGGTAAVLNVAGPEVIEPGASLEQWFRTGGLSCSTASHCIAVGNAASRTGQVAEVEVTRNGGRTWIAHQALSLPSGLVDVVCPTPLHCIAVGWEATITINGVIVVSSNGGVTWRVVHQTTGIDNQVNAVACSSTTICTAVGSKDIVLRTTDGGLRWAKQALPLQGVSPGVGLTSISCPSADRCVAEGRDLGNNGGYAFSTDNGGGTWTTSTYAWLTASEARDVSWMAGLACPTANDCLAVTGAVEFSFAERSADGGSVWSRLKLPAGPVDVRSIGCHDSWCVATAVSEKKAVLLSSVNGGSSWRVVTGPTGTSSLSNASCGPSSCWVSGVAKVSGATEIVELIRPGSSSTKKVGIR
jgi:photosystem II stability/assembly factor-like uncharacterized protein